MRARAALCGLLLLAACSRGQRAADPLDAGADQRARTAAKIDADLAAADRAAARPLPRPVAPRPVATPPAAASTAPDADDQSDVNRD